jgi:hypothetical protein
MSLSNQSATPQTNNDENNIVKELSQSNRNNGFMAEIFHTGVKSGALNLFDGNQIQVINAFAQNLCLVNQAIIKLSPNTINSQCFTKESAFPNHPVQAIEFDSTSKSSPHDSVHNSDVTMDNGLAHEQRSRPWVSEFADEGCEDGDVKSKSMEYSGNIHTSKKRCYVDSIGDQSNKTRRRPEEYNNNYVFSGYYTSIKEVEDYISESRLLYDKYSNGVDTNQPDCGKFLILFHK